MQHGIFITTKMNKDLILFVAVAAVFGTTLAKPNIKSRLIGGQEAAPHAYPYMVSIQSATIGIGYTYCGGALISKRYVVTAASCVSKIAFIATIKLGAVNPFIREPSQIVFLFPDQDMRYIYHPQYNSTTHENDIALVKLPEDIEENDYVKILALPEISQTFEDQTGVLTGWGLMDGNDGNSIARTLRYISAPILTNTECEKYLNGEIKSGHICLSGTGYQAGCEGDNGGPLAADGTLAGVFSFSSETCPVGLPSVATRITSYLAWLTENMVL